MARGLLVTHQHETELRIVLDGIVDGQNRTARNAEDVLDAQILQRTNQRFGAGHLFAVDNGLLFSGSGCLWHAAECSLSCSFVENFLVRGRGRVVHAPFYPLNGMLCNRLWRIAAAFLSDNESMLTADSLVRRKGPYSGALRAIVIWTIFFAIATLPCNAVS